MPWGNWGVDSNYAQRQDGNQFQGWKHLYNYWLGRWPWQWNSCTYGEYAPPNYNYYNYNNWTQQQGYPAVNVHGTKGVGVAVSCPRDTNGDGICDTGGCKDLFTYGEGNNWMSLYELDGVWGWGFPCWPDDLVETLYFPATTVYLSCTVGYCSGAGSPCYGPTWAYLTSAQMAMVVNFGVYQDSVFCEHQRSRDPSYRCTW